eukprot:507222-Pelagomonas_calceolata.AAC.6
MDGPASAFSAAPFRAQASPIAARYGPSSTLSHTGLLPALLQQRAWFGTPSSVPSPAGSRPGPLRMAVSEVVARASCSGAWASSPWLSSAGPALIGCGVEQTLTPVGRMLVGLGERMLFRWGVWKPSAPVRTM